jgi:hypothetical protein
MLARFAPVLREPDAPTKRERFHKKVIVAADRVAEDFRRQDAVLRVYARR